jgi:uncharacterized protein YfdQ (DUF2303 family)
MTLINDPELRNASNENHAAIDAGIALAEPHQVADGLHTIVVPAGASVKEIDVKAFEDKYADKPRRKTGTVHVQSAASFVEYLAKHGLNASEVWADPARKGLVGVINAHSGSDTSLDEGDAGHGDHRILLELVPTPEWTAWLAHDKKWMDQQAFAEHLEDNAADVVVPDAATMLEIAQTFHATTGTVFKSAQRLHSGEVTLNYEESTGARAGEKGDLEIPTEFTLAIKPFAGQEDAAEVIARFRYRIRGGQLSLSYALVRPEDHARAVFDDIVADVDANISQPVYVGRPA